MSSTCRRLVGRLVITAAAVVSGLLPVAARAASPPVSAARVVAHFNLARGQQPENIALEPDGSADLTFALGRQVARVTRTGQTDIVATLPAPRAGAICAPGSLGVLIMGIARAPDGTLYVNYCPGTAELQGIWRIKRGVAPVRIAALPPTGWPNGLALDRRTGYLYAADSRLGLIWRVSAAGGRPRVWANGPALAPTSFVGANGIKVHGNAIWASNSDRGTLVRIPLRRDGSAGAVQTRATGLGLIDDFGFLGPGDTLLAALITANQVAIVYPNGTHHTVLTAADGLSNPTSVAVRGTTVYVPSAAYYTRKDPNLLLAHLSR